jgi:nucleoid-associated protein YgaU
MKDERQTPLITPTENKSRPRRQKRDTRPGEMAETRPFCYLKRASRELFGGRGSGAGAARPGTKFSHKQGRVFVTTQGSTSPSKPPTRAEQEVQSAAERLNSQTEAALAAVAGRQTPGGVDELEASADRLERAARDLSVALRELVEERREKDKQL